MPELDVVPELELVELEVVPELELDVVPELGSWMSLNHRRY